MSPFTPTAQLRKRKTYQKRCAYIMQTLEHEKMSEIAAGSAVPAFRPGDVLRVKVEVLENRRRANWFTGVCIARRNRGMGELVHAPKRHGERPRRENVSPLLPHREGGGDRREAKGATGQAVLPARETPQVQPRVNGRGDTPRQTRSHYS